ncbi:DUF6843 domain-containing protein [Bacillus salitolerans]|uniref:DUF6843 domain-containing protein n=1 Tax=Bacillus salitolerans TaxID=1437434 RepID=A0ABW4LSF7_9BACI
MKRYWVIFFILFLISGCQVQERTTNLFLIPEGHIGWVFAGFNQSEYEELQKEGDFLIFKFDNNGELRTSTMYPETGVARDQFYYMNKNGKKGKEIDQETMIHGMAIGNIGEVKEKIETSATQVLFFFVGTEEDYNNAKPFEFPEDLKDF